MQFYSCIMSQEEVMVFVQRQLCSFEWQERTLCLMWNSSLSLRRPSTVQSEEKRLIENDRLVMANEPDVLRLLSLAGESSEMQGEKPQYSFSQNVSNLHTKIKKKKKTGNESVNPVWLTVLCE